MKSHIAGVASSLLVAGLFVLAACESNDGSAGTTGGFDAGDFDGNSPGSDAVAPGDGAMPGDGGSDADAEGGVTPPPPTPNDVYVDPTAGLDTNTGKSGSPFKTLTKAFSVVPGGAGVHLLDGTYDAKNEGSGFTVTIPADVNVRSENPGKATITGLIVKTTGGNTAVYDVVFSISAELDAVGTTSLLGSNLQFFPNSYNGVVVVSNSAQATLVGCLVDGKGSGGPTIGGGLYMVSGTGTLTLDGNVMQNTLGVGIYMAGAAAASQANLVIKNTSVSDSVYNPLFAGSNALVTIDHTTFKNATGAAVALGESVNVTITNSTFLQNIVAVSASSNYITTNNTFLKLATSTLTNNQRGIVWFAPGHVDVSDTTFTSVAMPNVGTTVGIELLAGAPSLSAIVRRTSIHGYDDGIEATTADATVTFDFGTGASPGNNDFSQNFNFGVNDELPAGLNLDAQGNTWNANVQSASATGKYPAGTTVTGPASGTNYNIVNGNTLNL